jgi:uncharacterized protein (TIGR02246 family)
MTLTNNITATRTDRDSAIEAVFAEVSRAWANGDADGFAAWYADGASAILPGFYLRDKDAIRAAMAVAFAGSLQGSRRTHEVQSLRFLGEGTAVAVTNSATVFPEQAEPSAQHRERATWVLALHGDRWLVEAYHGCPVDAV